MTADSTDTELIQKALGGQADAFGVLVERYRDAVYGATLSRISSRTEAQDVAQEAFIEAYRSLSALRDPTAFPSWLHTIVCRQCSRWHRSRHNNGTVEFVESDPPPASEIVSAIPQPDEAFSRRELRD